MGDNLKFENCKLTFQLEPQSPHIHFQWNQGWPTLRGSELKPKLDKFLYKKMKANEKLKYNDALDYKVKIVCVKKPQVVEAYSIYFGNAGKADEQKIKGVWSRPKVTIICFDSNLQEIIKDNIVEFFFVTNFGTMQGKGFGSYIISGTEKLDPNIVVKWLMNDCDTTKGWYCKYKGKESDKNEFCKKQFSWIKLFYGIMKRGQSFGKYQRSFLFEYMHKNENKSENTKNIKVPIDNEKAWMKQNKIAPTYSNSNSDNKHQHDKIDKNSRYVRAFLGVSGPQTWKLEKGKKIITVTDPEKKICRFPSPIFFKIYGDNICFVTKPIPNEMYNYEFKFEAEGGKSGCLSTPATTDFTGGTFDIEEFVSEYVKYYNAQSSQGGSNLLETKPKNFSVIKEWGC